jgi:hypothetical protein
LHVCASDWHNQQARYLLLTVAYAKATSFLAATTLSRLANEATMNRTKDQ